MKKEIVTGLKARDFCVAPKSVSLPQNRDGKIVLVGLGVVFVGIVLAVWLQWLSAKHTEKAAADRLQKQTDTLRQDLSRQIDGR